MLPVPLLHMRHPALRIIAPLNRDRIVKQLPQRAEFTLLLPYRRLLEIIHRKDRMFAWRRDERCTVRFVENQKRLVRVAVTEMGRDQREDKILWLNHSSHRAAVLDGETHKLLILMRFVA